MSLRKNYFSMFFLSCTLMFFSISAIAQNTTITGSVTDAMDDSPIPGVNVIVQGTSIGSVTDIDGEYTIDVPEGNDVLTFSYVGYQKQNIEIGNRSTIDVALQQDVEELSEIVVVGYGTQQRTDVTGSISSVSGEEINKQPITTIEQGLQGRAAGVNITQRSGAPGAVMDVQIRGIGSIGNSQPLFVVDGIPFINDASATGSGATNPLASINPADIESIEILKDASSAAIYGARAANGVVLITTKRGEAGETKITFDAYTGVQNAWRTLELTGIDGYKEISDELTDNANLPRVVALQREEELVNLTDWQDEVFQSSPINNVNVGFSGGSESARFNITANYLDQQGILLNSGLERLTFRVNTDFNKGRFRFGESLLVSQTGIEEFTGSLANALRMPPNRPVLNPNNIGGYAGNRIIDEQDANNPVAEANLFENSTTRWRVLGSFYTEYDILDDLTYRLNVGADFTYGNRDNYNPPYEFGERRTQPFATLDEENRYSISPLMEHTLNYRKSFGNSNLEVLAGYTVQTFKSRFANAEGRNTANAIVRTLDGVNDVPRVNGSLQEFSLISYLGRVNYNLADKYLFTINLRRDGSSRFSPDNKWGTFPSASFGWRVSNENFMAGIEAVSDLKLRSSWGQVGFQEIGNYTFQTVLANTVNYVFGGQQVTGVAQRRLAASNLQWETSTQFDIGFDLGLFNDQIYINADYYIKETENMLVPVPPSLSTGITNAPTLNAGSVRNSGLEFALTYRKSSGAFQYDISGNFATLNNEVLSLGGGQPIIGGNVNVTRVTRIIEGEPIGHFFGFVTDGIFQTQEEVEQHATQPNAQPGDIRFKDLSGPEGVPDGVINDLDKANIGDPLPNLIYGLTFNARWKNFDLNLFLQGVSGVELYYGYRYDAEGMLRPWNIEKRTLNRWTGPGTSDEIPRAIGGDPADNARESDRFIGDGSFLRARNFSIGYNIPSTTLAKFAGGFMSSVRIYGTAQNLFTLTQYEGFDPEIGTQSSNPGQFSRSRGIDGAGFPQARTFLLGVQVGF